MVQVAEERCCYYWKPGVLYREAGTYLSEGNAGFEAWFGAWKAQSKVYFQRGSGDVVLGVMVGLGSWVEGRVWILKEIHIDST